MGIIWFLFPIAFATDADCLHISPNVTDEECGNLDITMQYFDPNENCSQAVFNEKFNSLDLSFINVYSESYTVMRRELKETVWLRAREKAASMYQNERNIAERVYQITLDTTRDLSAQLITLQLEHEGEYRNMTQNLEGLKSHMDDAGQKLSLAQNALQNMSTTMRGFAELQNLYITIRAQSNRAHRCNAELRRVNARLMLGGVEEEDSEMVLEDCNKLLDENLAQKLLDAGASFCSSPESSAPDATSSRRFLSTNDLPKLSEVVNMTLAECREEAGYTDFRSLSTHKDKDTLGFQEKWFAAIDEIIHTECLMFNAYLRTYLLRRNNRLFAENFSRVAESMKYINQQASSIAVSTNTCASQAAEIYRKFKANAELLAKGQACGQKMTERWSADVEKCLKANAWTKVWLPWYNIPHLFGDENNCVKTRNLILGGMITAMSSVIIFFVVIWCLRCACACSCRWLRCRKSHGSRKRTTKRETKQTDGRTDQASNEGTKCTRTRTRPSKKDVLATVLENTRYHPSSDAASMSTNDHSSLVSDHSEFSRETNLYQPAVHPRTDYSSSSGYERNGRRSVASESSANSGRQPNESDLEAPALFYLPNLLPNNVISPPTLITLPHIRPSTDSAARIAVPFTPHLGFAPQGAVQPPFGALPPACRTSTRSRTVPSYLTPPNSPAPTSLTTSTPAPSGHVARSTTRHQTAFISRP